MPDLAKIQSDADSGELTAPAPSKFGNPRPIMRDIGPPSPSADAAEFGVALVRGPILSTLAAFNNEATPAIGLAFISGYLKKHGYNPVIVDAVGEGLNVTWRPEGIDGYQCQGTTIDDTVALIPDHTRVIGFSTMFSGEWPVHRRLIEAVRKKFPDAYLVAGGEHATALPEYSLRDCPALDAVAVGEGEHVFYEIVETVREGGDPAELVGVCTLNKDGTFRPSAGLTRIRDVDNIPWPYWPDGYLEKFWTAGKSFGIQTERDMPMMISRGCPFQCTFCSSAQMWTTRYLLRDIDDVIAEMKHYISEYKATSIQLYDLTAITKKQWTVELCQRMLDEGIDIKWSLPSGTRSEALDEETLDLLKRTGCTYLCYAPESGSPRTLELIKKRVSLDKLTDSVMAARKVGLTLRTNLIIGFPGETRADIFRTVWFGLRMAAGGVDEASINIYSAYPGTEIFAGLQDKGMVDLSDGYFLGLTSLNSDYTSFKPLTYNETIGRRELAVYRIGFMLTNYIISYLFYPKRILRTLRNVFYSREASTVFEHRLKDALARRRGKAHG
jgi:anaerobic magnesium-protoporphyrin IX monomethyl ester cyclase